MLRLYHFLYHIHLGGGWQLNEGLQVALSQIIHFLKHPFPKIIPTFDKNKAFLQLLPQRDISDKGKDLT